MNSTSIPTTSTTPAQIPAAAGPQGRSIGDILVNSGRLSAADLERILQRQREDKSQFGDAAQALKLLGKADIDYALSKQFDYPYLPEQDTSRSPELVAAYKPFSKVGEDLRALRSQLMLRWFNSDPARKVLALVSPGTNEGRSFIAANLAIVFSQQGERTLLIDADLRQSRQQVLFGMGKTPGLSGILAGRAGMEAVLPIPGLQGLHLLPAGTVPPNPQELLGRAAFPALLREAATRFDVIIIDTPSGTDYADAEVIAAHAGAALVLSRKHHTRLPDTALLARRLQDSGVVLVGAVLNDD